MKLTDEEQQTLDRLFQGTKPNRWWYPRTIWHARVKPFALDIRDQCYGLRYRVRMPIPEGYCPHPYCRAGTSLDDFLNRVPHHLPHRLNAIWFRNQNDALMCKLAVTSTE